MLQKLRSRHPIDLPFGAWGRKKAILVVLGGLTALFMLLPLAASALVALGDSVVRAAILVGAGVGTLLVVLAIAGMKGKHGWQR